MRILATLVLLIAAISGGAVYYTKYLGVEPPPNFRTAEVKRGDLLATIGATGTVEPEEVIDVGAQVAGKIRSLGRDPKDPKKSIDYGSVVEQGTVLANIDDAVYQAMVSQAQASLQRAKADLIQTQAKAAQAEQDWRRAERLRPERAIAESDYDLTVATYKAAKATVGVAEATIQQSQAALALAETNLGYTVIKSPVEGVIIDRRVNIGQTVVASLNAPSLFLIAKDLRKMQVWASVNEADIGRIHPGLPVHFRVDAFPGRDFRGEVGQVRLNAAMTQNVVTYTVVVVTDNSDLTLLPYLTANVQFEVDKHTGVLMVPNAALRWKPRPELIIPEMREAMAAASPFDQGSAVNVAAGGGESRDGRRPKDAAGKPATPRENRGRLWVKVGDFVRPVEVQIGETDGTMTQVNGDGIKDGTVVVMGENRTEQASSETSNPFAPKLFRGNRPQPKTP
jgi:HlyD family secretion protein